MTAILLSLLLALWPPITVHRGDTLRFYWCLADPNGCALEVVLPNGSTLPPTGRAPEWHWQALVVGEHRLRFRVQRADSPNDGTATEYEQIVMVRPNARPGFCCAQ